MSDNIFSRDWKPRTDNGPKHMGLIAKARREVDLADHLVYVTLPLVEDIKFILAIVDHIYNASALAIEGSLEQKKYYKKLEAFPRSYGAMTELWANHIMKDKFERKHLDFLKRLREVKNSITTSSMRFKRQDKYILTNDVYDLKVLDLDTVKKYLSIAKDFVNISEELISEEDKRQSVVK
jgi:hypothetical protein